MVLLTVSTGAIRVKFVHAHTVSLDLFVSSHGANSESSKILSLNEQMPETLKPEIIVVGVAAKGKTCATSF